MCNCNYEGLNLWKGVGDLVSYPWAPFNYYYYYSLLLRRLWLFFSKPVFRYYFLDSHFKILLCEFFLIEQKYFFS